MAWTEYEVDSCLKNWGTATVVFDTGLTGGVDGGRPALNIKVQKEPYQDRRTDAAKRLTYATEQFLYIKHGCTGYVLMKA